MSKCSAVAHGAAGRVGRSWIRLVAPLAAVAASCGVNAAEPEPLLEERSRVDVVVDWPFVIEPTRPDHADACSTLGVEDIRVEEDGTERKVLAVDRMQRPLNFVLMLDRSRSMSDSRGLPGRKLRKTQQAALQFVERLVPSPETSGSDAGDGFVTIVTFDDDLIMQVPPTPVADPAARSKLAAGIRRRSYGYDTALYDSLDRLVGYLEDLDQRSVVILLTDGQDNVSMTPATTLLARVAALNRLTVFPIAIGVRQDDYLEFLDELGEMSGGKRYVLRGGRFQDLDVALSRRFEDIRERLVQEAHVSYVASRSSRDGSGLVKVKITSRNERCVVRGFKPQRDTGQGPAARGAGRDPVSRSLQDGYYRLRIELTDIVRDRGPYMGSADREGPGVPQYEQRTVEVLAPPVDTSASYDPAVVLARWLESATSGRIVDPSEPGLPRADWINGTTFLDVRTHLGTVLYEQIEAYRVWASSRLEREVRRELFRELPPDTTPQVFEAIVRERLAEPREEDVAKLLADWRGDFHALELASAIERVWADDLVAAADRDAILDRITRGWIAMRTWLAPPARVRIVTPLVVLYDPAMQRFGFVRVVRPRPRSAELQSLPAWPLGVYLTRWLLESTDAGGTGPPDWGVREVRYGDPDAEAGTRSVSLRVGGGQTPDTTISVVAEAQADETRLRCFTIDTAGVDSVFSRAFQRSGLPECAEDSPRSSTTRSPYSPAQAQPSARARETAFSISAAEGSRTVR